MAGPSDRRVWRLAFPVILSNLSVPLLGAVDTAVMGHLPDPAYIGGVAVGALIFSYIYWGFGFLRMGTTGLVAQANGAKNAGEARAVFLRGLLLAGVIGAAVIALQGPIVLVALGLIDASAEVETLGRTYFSIRVWSAPAALIQYVVIGWLFGVQRMGSALAITVFANAINIVLDLWFVLGLGWGIEGVALATLIAEWSAALLGLTLVGRRVALGAAGGARVFDAPRLLRMLRVNGDIFIRTLCLVTAFAWFTAEGARMGDVQLAANAVLLNFQTFMAYGLDGFAHAAEALVGAAIGARDRDAFRDAVRTSTKWAALIAAGFALAYLAAGGALIRTLTDIETVRRSAAAFLPWAIASPLVSVWSFQLDGIFIGATRTAEMRNGMIVSLAGFLALTAILVPLWGNHGLWLSFLLFMALRAATLALWMPRIASGLPTARAQPIS
ncbi:MAG TPA: MATE family efflux transporter [Alphaproteobacteria bacterium]|jgi:MATE family multidrug resistance protein